MRLQLTDSVLDFESRVAECQGIPISLSERDWQLLGYLADRRGRAVSREELLTKVFGYAPQVETRALDASISRIRAKIESNPSDPSHLITVYGFGYRLDAPPPTTGTEAASPHAEPIGRASEIAQAVRIAQEEGQVTLVGPPGVGKSAIGLAVLRRLAPDGAPVLDLADVDSLSIPEGTGPILLDNADHLADAVRAWLERGSGRPAVVTSRERIRWSGEQVVRIDGLDRETGSTVFARLAGRMGVHRFDDVEMAAIGDIVELLDGLPLAIEYAASRTLLLRPFELLGQLRQRLAVLGGPSVGSSHDTMAVAVRWTWDRLERWEQEAVSQLAVFEGGFTLEAAAAVIRLDSAPPLMDVLQSLVDKCLCRRIGPGPRFVVYRILREFAQERLTLLPHSRGATERFLDWSAALAASGDPAALAAEAANLRAAFGAARLLRPALAARLALAWGRTLEPTEAAAVLRSARDGLARGADAQPETAALLASLDQTLRELAQ